jgi:transcriptional regulator with XRE-family HTH domain
LAERLGADQSYISKYERGERRIDVVELRAICGALGIELADFVRDFDRRLRDRGRP